MATLSNGTAHNNLTGDDASKQAYADAAAYAAQVQAKYSEERNKRIRPDFEGQFVKLHNSDKYRHFAEDPWLPVDGSVPGFQLNNSQQLHFKFVIQGAGYSGLLYGARLVEAGYDPKDFAFIDYAGGFGGTWYWNRYPGLMCDILGEVYMPLLEETGHVPTYKYAYGQELREQAERITAKYGFQDRGIFRATVSSATWKEDDNVWQLKVRQEQGPGQGPESKKVEATLTGDFFILMGGILNYPKLPRLQGIDDFKGYQFHTSRWDYKYTGGSQEKPDLSNLQDKSVALVGTGSSGVQILPELAKWCKELYLIQRTPSAVDVRGQGRIDQEEWKKSHSEPGWQKLRRDQFAAIISNEPDKPDADFGDDHWVSMPSYKGLIGGRNNIDPMRPETIVEYVQHLHMLDFPRQERIRARVDEVVKDKDTAQRLKPWYAGWCKRPCFHDDYLSTFNKPNVKLIDTEGKGINGLTGDGVVVGDKEYKIDVLIWGTGYYVGGFDSPAERAQITVQGRDGRSMSQKWKDGVGSLHGVTTRGFPNFFYPLSQVGTTANNVHNIDAIATHTAYIVREAEKRNPGKKVLIEPTHEAEEIWSMRVASNAASMAALSGCTPSYITMEGRLDTMQTMSQAEQFKRARGATWGQGFLDYQTILDEWRENGKLEGLDLTVIDRS